MWRATRARGGSHGCLCTGSAIWTLPRFAGERWQGVYFLFRALCARFGCVVTGSFPCRLLLCLKTPILRMAGRLTASSLLTVGRIFALQIHLLGLRLSFRRPIKFPPFGAHSSFGPWSVAGQWRGGCFSPGIPNAERVWQFGRVASAERMLNEFQPLRGLETPRMRGEFIEVWIVTSDVSLGYANVRDPGKSPSPGLSESDRLPPSMNKGGSLRYAILAHHSYWAALNHCEVGKAPLVRLEG